MRWYQYAAFLPVFRGHGTDFRRELTNLKGLIYFTDGFGIFPAQKPKYDTAFVFIDDEYNQPEVPVWAIRILLQSEDI